MKITIEDVNHNAVRLIKDLVGTAYDIIMPNDSGNYQNTEERGFMLMTLGEIQGVLNMAQAMKEVLKA